MTLSTHAIVGASIASIAPSHPLLGFALGFASHFLLDAIPHWDYRLPSMKDTEDPMKRSVVFGKKFVFDLLKMTADTALGIIVVLLIFGFSDTYSVLTPLCGAVGGLAPDALQFIFLRWKHEPMVSLQRFHTVWVHSKIKLNDRPALGISLQAIMVILIAATFRAFFS